MQQSDCNSCKHNYIKEMKDLKFSNCKILLIPTPIKDCNCKEFTKKAKS